MLNSPQLFTTYNSKTEILLFHPGNSFASHYSCSPVYQKFSSATNLGETFKKTSHFKPLFFYQCINEMCSHVSCILDLFTHLEVTHSQYKQANLPYTFIIHYLGQTNASAFCSTCPKHHVKLGQSVITSYWPISGAICPDLKILLITFKANFSQPPNYLSELLIPYKPEGDLLFPKLNWKGKGERALQSGPLGF